MFVRFRQQGSRLQASLTQTRRIAGKMHTEHIASLGSVDADVSIRERLAFWSKLPDRLARLGNRVGSDEHGKIYGALHARIPMVTPDDQRAIQEENAKDDEQFWETMHGVNVSTIAEHKALIAKAETKIAELAPKAEEAAERAEAAKGRVAKIRRGEDVAGGLGKRFTREDAVAILKAMGWTPKDFRQMELQGSLTSAEFETLFEPPHSTRWHDALDQAFDREVRRIIRARRAG
jgi:hypothetical protein